MRHDDLPDFAGKVVLFYLTNHTDPKRGGTAVFDPKFVTEGGRLFVRGTIPHNTTPKDWSGGATTGIAWDHVVEYTIFDSAEDYLRRIAPFTNAEPVQ